MIPYGWKPVQTETFKTSQKVLIREKLCVYAKPTVTYLVLSAHGTTSLM